MFILPYIDLHGYFMECIFEFTLQKLSKLKYYYTYASVDTELSQTPQNVEQDRCFVDCMSVLLNQLFYNQTGALVHR